MELIVIVATIAFFIGLALSNKTRKRPPYKRFNQQQPSEIPTPEIPLDDKFLNAVRQSDYTKRKLLNSPEQKIYWVLVKLLKGSFYIHPQASLGELVTCKDKTGYSAINSKRSDFTITDKNFYPVAVIEYQGSGHFQGNHEIRSTMKATAMNNAGIAYVQLYSTELEEIRSALIEFNLLKQPEYS